MPHKTCWKCGEENLKNPWTDTDGEKMMQCGTCGTIQSVKEMPSGVGCFGLQDNRCHACQTCGDWSPCKAAKAKARKKR